MVALFLVSAAITGLVAANEFSRSAGPVGDQSIMVLAPWSCPPTGPIKQPATVKAPDPPFLRVADRKVCFARPGAGPKHWQTGKWVPYYGFLKPR
jgi:hypothetical protein